MTKSKHFTVRKVEKFEKKLTERGAVPEKTAKRGKVDSAIGHVPSEVLPLFCCGFFIFVVIGSSLFRTSRTATSGSLV
ncbi:putative stress-associated endoplasmic reticulum protein [Rosa chinensis]|uniref:Putative stress-associated endoplasmic reticulum protein n=1 Tax=Rosa chinensis TaxID=74649 RepID=A0A2P6Q2X3_ROSCH|nr:putative stress-associated endoplasmic reticulum protein [Rosa chinensis]